MLRVLENTYPVHDGVAHANVGDDVHWRVDRGVYNLIRASDGKTVFSTAPVDRDGKLRSNGKDPVLSGAVAQVKRRGWCLVIGEKS